MRSVQQIAIDLLMSMKIDKDPSDFIQELANMSNRELEHQLQNDSQKKAFWINCYNAYFLYLKKVLKKSRPNIYTNKVIIIGSINYSLDDIEHGIIRKYRSKFSGGFLPNWFITKNIRQKAVLKIDYRIHFALNCGAKSCPPIAFYNDTRIDEQLDLATRSFLETETIINKDYKVVKISQLMKWYIGDFGGYKGIRKMIKKYLNINIVGYKIKFSAYNWEEDLNNFNNE